MRLLGLPIESPQAIINRALSDLNAIARLAQTAPAQLDALHGLGEEIAEIGRQVLDIGQRLDRRAEAIMQLGERLDSRAAELLEVGASIRDLGDRADSRGAEIVDRATVVAETGAELIAVLPAFERAVEMATPLEGAIDRFGRLVDRLPGGATRRRAEHAAEAAMSSAEQSKDAQEAAERSSASVDPAQPAGDAPREGSESPARSPAPEQ